MPLLHSSQISHLGVPYFGLIFHMSCRYNQHEFGRQHVKSPLSLLVLTLITVLTCKVPARFTLSVNKAIKVDQMKQISAE